MANITFRAAGALATGSAVSSVTPAAPAGVLATDLVLSFIQDDGGTGITVTPPAGWTLILRTNDTTNQGLSVYWAPGSAVFGAYSFNTATEVVARTYAYSGVNLTTPMDTTAAGQVSAATTTITAPSRTTVTPFALYVAFFIAVDAIGNPLTITVNAPLTQRTADSFTSTAPDTLVAGVGDEATGANPGVVAATTATISTTQNGIGIAVVLRPSAPSGEDSGRPVPPAPTAPARIPQTFVPGDGGSVSVVVNRPLSESVPYFPPLRVQRPQFVFAAEAQVVLTRPVHDESVPAFRPLAVGRPPFRPEADAQLGVQRPLTEPVPSFLPKAVPKAFAIPTDGEAVVLARPLADEAVPATKPKAVAKPFSIPTDGEAVTVSRPIADEAVPAMKPKNVAQPPATIMVDARGGTPPAVLAPGGDTAAPRTPPAQKPPFATGEEATVLTRPISDESVPALRPKSEQKVFAVPTDGEAVVLNRPIADESVPAMRAKGAVQPPATLATDARGGTPPAVLAPGGDVAPPKTPAAARPQPATGDEATTLRSPLADEAVPPLTAKATGRAPMRPEMDAQPTVQRPTADESIPALRPKATAKPFAIPTDGEAVTLSRPIADESVPSLLVKFVRKVFAVFTGDEAVTLARPIADESVPATKPKAAQKPFSVPTDGEATTLARPVPDESAPPPRVKPAPAPPPARADDALRGTAQAVLSPGEGAFAPPPPPAPKSAFAWLVDWFRGLFTPPPTVLGHVVQVKSEALSMAGLTGEQIKSAGLPGETTASAGIQQEKLNQ